VVERDGSEDDEADVGQGVVAGSPSATVVTRNMTTTGARSGHWKRPDWRMRTLP
jgi:hypothetical protein